jgi:hypothetical protein
MKTPRTRTPDVYKRGIVGAPSSQVRAASRLAFAERIPTLCAIADGTLRYKTSYVTRAGQVIDVEHEPSLDDRIKAIDKLGKYGGLMMTNIASEDTNNNDEHIKAAAIGGAIAALAALAAKLAGGNEQSLALALDGEVKSINTTG